MGVHLPGVPPVRGGGTRQHEDRVGHRAMQQPVAFAAREQTTTRAEREWGILGGEGAPGTVRKAFEEMHNLTAVVRRELHREHHVRAMPDRGCNQVDYYEKTREILHKGEKKR